MLSGTMYNNLLHQTRVMIMFHKDKIHKKVYYRSDTRSPEKIFKNGFTAYEQQEDSKWWKDSIEEHPLVHSNGEATLHIPPDANVQRSVSLSSCLNTVGLFPIDEEEFDEARAKRSMQHQFDKNKFIHPSYIYAVSVPAAYKINKSKELSDQQIQSTPYDLKDAVIDLHDYQTERAQAILENAPDDYIKQKNNIKIAACTLCGYEVMAYHIKPENIMFAVKILRSNLSAVRIEGTHCNIYENRRKFIIDDKIQKNANFKVEQMFTQLDANNKPISVAISYKNEQEMALRQLQEAQAAGEHITPSITDGLRGKVFYLSKKHLFLSFLCNPIANSANKKPENEEDKQTGKKVNLNLQ